MSPDAKDDRFTPTSDPSTAEIFSRWRDWIEVAREEELEDRRERIYDIFSERLMIALSLILLPVLVLPLAVELPSFIIAALSTVDFAILMIFALEYTLKLAYAENKKAFFIHPWHLLDLFIVLVPLVGLLVGIGYSRARFFRLLRLLRITQAASLSDRAYHRRSSLMQAVPPQTAHQPPLRVCAVALDESLADRAVKAGWRRSSLSSLADPAGREKTWHDLSCVSKSDISEISELFGPTSYILRNKLNSRAYPQAEDSSGLHLLLIKVPCLENDREDSRKIRLSWKGLLFIDDGHGIATISQHELPSLQQIPAKARAESLPLTPPAIAYLILRESLDVVEELIWAGEEEQMALESLPMDRLPSGFLAALFRMKKEMGLITSWLLHLKEALNMIETRKVALHAWEEADAIRFKSLLDRCGYLHDAAGNCSDNFSDLIDFYINSTSFQMNKVMKVLAIITALAIFPAVAGGLLGTNIMGAPWSVTLPQLTTLVAIAMLATGWICYKLGWMH